MNEKVDTTPTKGADVPAARERSRGVLAKVDDDWLDGYLETVRESIVDEANSISSSPDQRPNGLDVAEAARRYAPGMKFPAEPSFRQRLAAQLSGITVVCMILAITFGVLAYFLPDQREACFDIVKIFAGAIVGSTGASVVAVASRRR